MGLRGNSLDFARDEGTLFSGFQTAGPFHGSVSCTSVDLTLLDLNDPDPFAAPCATTLAIQQAARILS